MIDRIAQTLQIDSEEARRAVWLGGILFVLTASYTLVKTARDALYLTQLPARTLPYVYLGVGILTTVTAALFTRLTRRRPGSQSFEAAAWVSAISLAAFAYLFRLEARWVAVVFYLWVNVYGLILVSQFWAFTTALSNPREAKRIFGTIGVGGIIGGLFAGLVAAPLVRSFSLSALLLTAATLVALGAWSMRSNAGAPEAAGSSPAAADDQEALNPVRHRYVRWMALAALCSVLAATLVDYQFKVELQRRIPSPHDLASFFGLFYTATNLAALTMQLFATRWSLQTLGAGWSAAVLPAGLGLGAAFTMLAPGFGAVITTRLWDQVMRVSINKSAIELFFFPLEPGLRRRAKALIEAGLERLGDALAGLLIIVASAFLGGSIGVVAAIVALLVAVWVSAWLGVRRGYVVELGRNLRRMSFANQQSTVSLREASLLQEMTRLLDSPFERVVLHGIDMLQETAPERVQALLPRLLEHQAPAVRARALELAASTRAPEARKQLAALMHDEHPEVRVAALHAYGALGGENQIETLEKFLASEDPRQRQAAIECIAQYALPVEEGRARAILERVLREGSVEDRAAMARGLGSRPGPSGLHDWIAALIKDPSPAVRQAALLAAGRAGLRGLVPKMIDALSLREVQAAARAGLGAFGDRLVGTLSDYLSDASVSIQVRREIPRVLGVIGTQEAANALMRCRERDDVRLAYRVLKAANHIRAQHPEVRFGRERVTEDLEFDVKSYLFVLVHYRACPIGGSRTAERLLCIALNERMDQAMNRIFRRLALIYSPRDIYAAYRGITSENPRLRGNALEYVENALAPEHRSLVLLLIDDSGDEARLRFAEARYGFRYVGYDQTLEELLKGSDPWLRSCALYVAGTRREPAFLPLVESSLASLDPHVRETAAWARLALAKA